MSKQQPLGSCDNCLTEINPDDPGWYTSKGKPRLYCCRQCRNEANSRAGAEIRAEKARQRVRRGEWQNPADINRAAPSVIGAGVSRARKREVEDGTWRNPALDDAAREKLSRPRKHGDNPALHRAIEKMRDGTMADLTPEEEQAFRRYRRALRNARRDEANADARQRYHQRQAGMSEDEREAQRARWREQWRRRNNKD